MVSVNHIHKVDRGLTNELSNTSRRIIIVELYNHIIKDIIFGLFTDMAALSCLQRKQNVPVDPGSLLDCQ